MPRTTTIALTALIAVSTACGQTKTSDVKRQAAPLNWLEARVVEVSFNDLPLEQVIDWLSEYAGVNVTVRWRALEDAGIDRDTPISVKARNLRLSQILGMILRQAGGSDVKLAYRAERDLLTLSLHEDFEKEVTVRVYDLADLLLRVPHFRNARPIDVAETFSGPQSGSSRQSLGGEKSGQAGDENDRSTLESDMQELIKLIVETIEPESWQTAGGRGTISALRRQIIVRNSLQVHQMLAGHASAPSVRASR